MRTPSATLNATGVTINAKIDGELRVQLTNAEGAPYAGFSFEECKAMHGDSTAHPVSWTGDIAELQGQPVGFEFRMKNTQLFGFDIIDPKPLLPQR